jgi:hypothetical protein
MTLSLRPDEHVWVSGQDHGLGAEKLCQRCGVRQSNPLAGQECKPRPPAQQVARDYDPLEAA